jgi:predicted DCC family thiol-disulfide oxidoreductase YuxK
MKLLTGGGPNVAANTQVAKVANQTLGSSVATGDQKVEKIEGHHNRVEQVQSQDNKVKTESVEKVVINEVPPWVILLLLVGWLLPTPQDIGNRIYLWLSHLVSKLKWRK